MLPARQHQSEVTTPLATLFHAEILLSLQLKFKKRKNQESPPHNFKVSFALPLSADVRSGLLMTSSQSKVDADKSGCISADELKAAMAAQGAAERAIEELFSYADANNDGKVSREEWEKVTKEHKKRLGLEIDGEGGEGGEGAAAATALGRRLTTMLRDPEASGGSGGGGGTEVAGEGGGVGSAAAAAPDAV